MRKIIFQNNYYYHIYNRGVDKRKIFLESRDYVRFIKSMRSIKEKGSAFLNKSEPLNIELICYCLIPNHFHLLIKQNSKESITSFIHKLSTSYSMYFNYKYQRTGSLFQGRYKAAEIKSDEHLIYLSAYINANSLVHNISNKPENYTWSSYPDYLDLRDGTLCSKEIVLSRFKDINKYRIFVENIVLDIMQHRKYAKLIIE